MRWATESHITLLAATLMTALLVAAVLMRLSENTRLIARGILAFTLAWAVYSIPWALLSLAMRFPASIVLSTLFFTLGGLTALGALFVRPPTVGGFLGGGIPLATLALFYTSSNANLLKTASALAWFAVFMLLGGLLGAITGPTGVRMVHNLEWLFRLERSGTASPSHVSTTGDHGPSSRRETISERPAAGHRIFISYAHLDNTSSDPRQRYLDRLLEQLRALALEDEVCAWSDKNVEIGENWRAAIRKSIADANAAVLLVSPAFLGSAFIRTNELPPLLDKSDVSELLILPVILRPCLFRQASFKYPDPIRGPKELCLGDFQCANSPDAPLNSLSEHEQDRVLLSVAERLSAILRKR